MSEKTKGETLFEEYLRSAGIANFEFEAEIPGCAKRPDYRLVHEGSREHVLVEKIGFRLNPEDWDQLEIEWLWAEPVGQSEYEIRSLPFFAYGISSRDIVSAKDEDGRLFFVKVLLRGGHSTYRLLLAPSVTVDSVDFLKSWTSLKIIGCSFELAKTSWLSVDVPADVDINEAYSLLELGESAGVWQVFEGNLGHRVEQ